MPFTGLLGQSKPKVEKILDYTFRDDSLLYEALVAYPLDSGGRTFSDGNKRLAMLGDCALKLVVARDCYAKGLSKGAADIRRQKLESDEELARIAGERGIGEHIIAAPGTHNISMKMRATAVEALLGAVFLDCAEDLADVRRVVATMGILEDD